MKQWIAWDRTVKESDAELYAWVFLQDHSHIILRQGTRNFSKLMHSFKRRVNWMYKDHYNTVWQKRFWEHMIRNDEDLITHCDYIHFNPVKHNYVSNPIDYPYSSFKSFVENGRYSEGWASDIDIEMTGEPRSPVSLKPGSQYR